MCLVINLFLTDCLSALRFEFRALIFDSYQGEIFDIDEEESAQNEKIFLKKQEDLKKCDDMIKKSVESFKETGLNPLFLSLGVLEWTEKKYSNEPIYSPLVLVPIRINHEGGYHIEYTDDPVESNFHLYKLFSDEFKCKLPNIESYTRKDGMLLKYNLHQFFKDVEKACEGIDGQNKVHSNKAFLALFNASSSMVYRDLYYKRWLEKDDSHVDISDLAISILLKDKKFYESQVIENKKNTENEDEAFHVVDADKSQKEALEVIESGRSLVLKGPPGTGKSQTIVNMIASAVNRGKSVLFVTEKMAALEVVKEKLDTIKLGDAVLDLHDFQSTNRKYFFKEIENSINNAVIRLESIEDNFSKKRKEISDFLNEYDEIMSKKIKDTGLSLSEALEEKHRMSRIIKEEKVNDIMNVDIGRLTKNEYGDLKEKFKKYCLLISKYEMGIKSHPLYECCIDIPLSKTQAFEFYKMIELLEKKLESYSLLFSKYSERGVPFSENVSDIKIILNTISFLEEMKITNGYNYSTDKWILEEDRIPQIIEEGGKISESIEKLNAQFSKKWVHIDYSNTQATLKKHKNQWYKYIIPNYIWARKKMRDISLDCVLSDDDCIDSIDLMGEVKNRLKNLNQHSRLMKNLIGHNWASFKTDWILLAKNFNFICDIHKKIERKEVLDCLLDILSKKHTFSKENGCFSELNKVHDEIIDLLTKIQERSKFFINRDRKGQQ